MKKFKHFLMLLVMFALVLTTVPVSAQAAAKKSAVMKKADAVTKDLTKYANYRGWEVSTKVTKKSSKQVKKRVRIETASGTYFSYIQTTKKSGKKYKTYFVSKGRKFKLSEVKSGVKNNSSSKTVKSFLKARAQKSAKSLASYAKIRGWGTSTKVVANTKKAIATVTFSNKQYKFNITATVKRSKAPRTAYTKNGKKSTAKDIKSWLEQYKDATSNTTPGATDAPNATDSPDDKPGPNPSAITDDEVVAMVKTKADTLIAAGKAKGWTITEAGRGTMEIKLHFANSAYQFDTTIKGANQAGKAVIGYTLMGVESDETTVVSWINDLAAAPLPDNTNTTAPSESPKPSESPTPSIEPKPISGDDLKKAAASAMDELKVASSTNEWSYVELVNSGSRIQVSFENSEWEFKVATEAKAEDGKIVVHYTLSGGSEGETDRETILDWFVKYKAAPKPTDTPKPTETPTPSQTPGTSATPPVATKTPEPGNTQPPSTTTPPSTTQQPPSSTTDLTVVAKRAMTELEIEGALKNWSFKRITEDKTKVWNYFYNSTYGFYVSTEAKSEDGTVVLAYTVKAKADDKQAVLGNSSEELIKWFATYRTAAAKEEPNNVAGADQMETEFTTDIPPMPCRLALDNMANGAVVGPNDAQPTRPTK